MESTLIIRLSLLVFPSKSRPLSPLAFAGARRLASVSFSSASGCGVLRPRGGSGDAGVVSSVSPAAAALGEAAGASSEAILLSVQGMMCDGCAASVKRILQSQKEADQNLLVKGAKVLNQVAMEVGARRRWTPWIKKLTF